MKTVLLDFSRDDSICAHRMKEMRTDLEEAGVSCVFFKVKEVRGCTGCGKCWKKRRCVIEDDVNRVKEAMTDSDGLIIGCESYYERCDANAMRFLIRLYHSASEVLDHKIVTAVLSGRRSTEKAFAEIMGMMEESHACIYIPDGFGKAEEIKSSTGLALLLEKHEQGEKDGVICHSPYIVPFEKFVR